GPLFFVFTAGMGSGQAYLDAVPGHQVQLGLAALAVFAMGVAGLVIIGAMYPVLRAQSEGLAAGALLFRGVAEGGAFLEAAITLATVSLGLAALGSTAEHQLVLLSTLLDLRDQVALVATTGFGIAALQYCWVFFSSRLLPRWLAGWGLAGAVIWLAGSAWAFAVHAPDAGLLMAPLALNELVMAVWLIARGFSSPSAARVPAVALAAA
ncbi:MAG TPA: DUF4386 domain-containing protein, partial [Candidatus Limnocylindrales bacterium]